MKILAYLWLFLAMGFSGCDAVQSDFDPANLGDTGVEDPTYHEHIQPILAKNCVNCHQPGGLSHIDFTDQANVESYSGSILYDIENRIMPPYVADNSGECRTYTNARWMSDGAIETVRNWVDQGLEEGNSRIAETPAPRIELPEATQTVETPLYETQESPDEYRCFAVDPKLASDKFLTGYWVKPGNTEIAHHMVMFSVDDRTYQKYVKRSLNDGKPGFDCYSTPFELFIDENQMFGTWAPGVGFVEFPNNTGVRLPADSKLILQMHYNTAARPETKNRPQVLPLHESGVAGSAKSDSSAFGMILTDTVKDEVFVRLVDDFDLELEPGLSEVSYDFTWRLNDLDSLVYFETPPDGLTLLGVGPHMHERGIRQQFELIREDGSQECLQRVNRWDYEWQEYFFYEEPVEIGVNDKIKLTCTYDTSEDTQRIEWGEGTQDEMCMVFVVYKKNQ